MADLTTLTAELAGMKQKMVDRLVAQGDETIQPDDTMQTIVDHFDNLRTKIVNQDKEITANGEYTADEGYTGLGKVTVDVKAEPVPKFGVTIDNFLGDVDANGVLQAPTEKFDLVFTGVREIAANGLYNTFTNNTNLTSVDLSSLITVGNNGLYNTFYNNTNLTSVDLSSLITVGSRGLYNTFNNNTNLTSVDLSSLTTVGSEGLYNTFGYDSKLTSIDLSSLTTVNNSYAFRYTFRNCSKLTNVDLSSLIECVGTSPFDSCFTYCSGLTNVDFSSLTTLGGDGLYQAFTYCSGLKTMSFPSLTSVSTNALRNTFYGCTALTEIHFRADMQSVIEGLTGYSSKFGAPSTCTIYFDL